jgi:hypothetical protein
METVDLQAFEHCGMAVSNTERVLPTPGPDRSRRWQSIPYLFVGVCCSLLAPSFKLSPLTLEKAVGTSP